jgi:hypothetical protein
MACVTRRRFAPLIRTHIRRDAGGMIDACSAESFCRSNGVKEKEKMATLYVQERRVRAHD